MQMQRYLALLATVLLASAAFAQEGSLREELDQLRQRAEAIETQRQALFEREVESYLAKTDAEHGAQGGDALQGVVHERYGEGPIRMSNTATLGVAVK